MLVSSCVLQDGNHISSTDSFGALFGSNHDLEGHLANADVLLATPFLQQLLDASGSYLVQLQTRPDEVIIGTSGHCFGRPSNNIF